MRLTRTILAVLLVLLALPLSAQGKPPVLHGRLDPNDWRSYQAVGMLELDHAYFKWARRLDPARAEPVMALWLARGRHDGDTLIWRFLVLDPFVHVARLAHYTMPKRGIFTSDATDGWNALAEGDYFRAANDFRSWVAAHPDSLEERGGLAVARFWQGQYAASAALLRELEELIPKHHADTLVRVYESREIVAFMEGTAWWKAGRADSARAALGRSLAENLSFYPARMLLADLALESADTAAAAAEWEQVRELMGHDPVARRRYALFLFHRGDLSEAERQLRLVVREEPEWRDAELDLATVIEAAGPARRAEAKAALERWLAHAPQSQVGLREEVAARITRLSGT